MNVEAIFVLLFIAMIISVMVFAFILAHSKNKKLAETLVGGKIIKNYGEFSLHESGIAKSRMTVYLFKDKKTDDKFIGLEIRNKLAISASIQVIKLSLEQSTLLHAKLKEAIGDINTPNTDQQPIQRL